MLTAATFIRNLFSETILEFHPLMSEYRLIITHPEDRQTVWVGIYFGSAAFFSPCWLQPLQSYNKHWGEAGVFSSPCAALAVSRWSVLKWDSGGSGWICATAGHQSHCGISSTFPIRRLQPVKVSVLLIPDFKSSSYGPGYSGESLALAHFLANCAAVWEDLAGFFSSSFFWQGNSGEESRLWQRWWLPCAIENERLSLFLCISPNHLITACNSFCYLIG